MRHTRQERTRLEEILAEWDMDSNYEPASTQSVTLSATPNSITSPITVTGTGFSNVIYTTGTTAPWFTSNPTGAKIQLDGEDADITVNGWSLVDAVKRIEERLGLYQPNPKLEAEWEELRELGERYRELEKKCKEKNQIWHHLKKPL